jgi:hypothetical protein
MEVGHTNECANATTGKNKIVKTHHTVEVYRGNTSEYSGNEITETKAQQCIKYSVT